MNLRLTLTVVAAFFGLAACATNSAQTASNTEVNALVEEDDAALAAADTEQVADENDESRIICKRKIVTGSRFTKNICMTWGEWKDMEKNSKDYVTTTQRRLTQQGNPQGN